MVPGPVVAADALLRYFDDLLDAGSFRDYCPNGLQVEGERAVRTLVSGVTASAALLRAAAALRADAVLVHHGWFWRGEDPRIVGSRRERFRLAIDSGIHLFAYHLPLDAHPDVGNNARLGLSMGWKTDARVGDNGLVCVHDLSQPGTAVSVAAALRRRLGRKPLVVGDLSRPIRRVAWCTGAAQDMLQVAIDAGADAFVSGEISERTTHLARESRVVYFSAGHHATERMGVQALGEAAALRFGIRHRFVDDDNPV